MWKVKKSQMRPITEPEDPFLAELFFVSWVIQNLGSQWNRPYRSEKACRSPHISRRIRFTIRRVTEKKREGRTGYTVCLSHVPARFDVRQTHSPQFLLILCGTVKESWIEFQRKGRVGERTPNNGPTSLLYTRESIHPSIHSLTYCVLLMAASTLKNSKGKLPKRKKGTKSILTCLHNPPFFPTSFTTAPSISHHTIFAHTTPKDF